MKKLLFFSIAIAFLAACNQRLDARKNHSISTTINSEAENGAIEVEKFFGGNCTYLIDSSSKRLSVELRNSDSIARQNPNKLFGDVAETFCKRLKKTKEATRILN